MTRTLLFVHGTGVRQSSFVPCLRLLQQKAAEFLPGWRVEGCLWGDAFGAKLNLKGVSIPGYDASGNAVPALEAASRARWILLAGDPLLELRVATEKVVIGAPPGPKVWQAVLALQQPPPSLQAALVKRGVAEEWPALIDEIAADPAWAGTIKALTLDGNAVNDKVAAALVAALQVRLRTRALPLPIRSGRDELVLAVREALGGALGLVDWFARRLTNMIKPRRGVLTDATGPGVGDILRYQARGETLRNFIGEEVQRTGAEALIAHSLGGIACVDWLAESERRPVRSLVTIGSQAPYLYEIDALTKAPFGGGLPEFFPRRWLNIFDERDFLSYRGEGVFPGRVQDVQADNGQPFPESHGAYWHNDDDVWRPLARFLA